MQSPPANPDGISVLAADLETIADTQEKLVALAANADALLARLEAVPGHGMHGAVATLVAEGKTLLQQLQAAGAALAPLLDEAARPPMKANRQLTDALWVQHERAQAGDAAAAVEAAAPAQPPPQPAASLPELLHMLSQSLPGAALTPLLGGSAAEQPERATGLQLRLGDALAFVVQLQQPGGLAPLRVAALSAQEGQLPLPSTWAVSRHAVFRRVTAIAAAALRHLEAEAESQPASALELLLLWLATYSDLFTRPSSASGRLLALDEEEGALLPPCWRPYRQLGWQQLWQLALEPRGRAALHAEPAEERWRQNAT